MALLKCPECGKMVSEMAPACPNCGCPMEDIKAAALKEENTEQTEMSEKEKQTVTSDSEDKPAKKRNRRLPVIIAAVVIVIVLLCVGITRFMSYRSAHASQLLHDWTFISLVYTENGQQQDALDTASFTSAGQDAPTLTVNKDGTYELTALGTEYSGEWTRYSDDDVAKLDGVKQAYNLENSQGLQITAMIQDDAVGDDNTADAVTVVITEPDSESASSGSTETASANDFYAFLFERTGN